MTQRGRSAEWAPRPVSAGQLQGPGAAALVFPGFLRLGLRRTFAARPPRWAVWTPASLLESCLRGHLGPLLGRGRGLSQACWAAGGAVPPSPDKYSPPPASEEGQCLRPGVGLPEGPPVLAGPGLRLRLTQTRGLSLPQQLSSLQFFEKAGGHLSLGLSARAGRGWGPRDKGGAGPQIQPSPQALKVFLSVLPFLKKQVIKHS